MRGRGVGGREGRGVEVEEVVLVVVVVVVEEEGLHGVAHGGVIVWIEE